MALPAAREARTYYRCAKQRFDDAIVLNRAAHRTGAVYLAGYGIECILKALILSILASGPREAMLKDFRGNLAHNYDWLREQYLTRSGLRFPVAINREFLLVADWSTDLRYLSGNLSPIEANAFLHAAEAIIEWADGRL
jgi:hypothetical protein